MRVRRETIFACRPWLACLWLVVLFFAAAQLAFSSITFSDAHGKSASAAQSVVDPAAYKRILIALDAMAPGVYTVDWMAVTLARYRTLGHYSFAVR
ncbi:hypothetical protein KQH60_09595 [Mycetohabitans sp. B8]|uniref:copper resistance protein CopC n=1 Tax=Mycetohabitans sp. B8 TaxID=2841845 RepID=UPI001F2A29CA|nr:copper resistance protein CopC [Mycetohabitans sp. B8]MCG1042776.1 hypothetical protein [Mycetohabitans sp. B8]